MYTIILVLNKYKNTNKKGLVLMIDIKIRINMKIETNNKDTYE